MTRRWFQIHLSTAIVLMLAASLMIGLTLLQDYPASLLLFTRYGWPWDIYTHIHLDGDPDVYWSYSNAASNLAFCLFVLFSVAHACESRHRRSPDAQPDSPGTRTACRLSILLTIAALTYANLPENRSVGWPSSMCRFGTVLGGGEKWTWLYKEIATNVVCALFITYWVHFITRWIYRRREVLR